MDNYKKGLQMDIRISPQFIDTLKIILEIIAGLSAIVTVIPFFSKRKNAGGSIIRKISVTVLILSVISVVILMASVVQIPHIEHSSWDVVTMDLINKGLEYDIENRDAFDENNKDLFKYTLSDPSESHQYTLKGTQISLKVTGRDVSNQQAVHIPEPEIKAMIQAEKQDSNDSLAIKIDNYELSSGYHYEYPDPDDASMTNYIDYGPGLHGTFSYSRPLDETEIKNFEFTGFLYDQAGNVVDSPDIHPHFWVLADGLFAVEFPEYMKPGTYTYVLTIKTDNGWVSDKVTFRK